jgi:hypothetical protein
MNTTPRNVAVRNERKNPNVADEIMSYLKDVFRRTGMSMMVPTAGNEAMRQAFIMARNAGGFNTATIEVPDTLQPTILGILNNGYPESPEEVSMKTLPHDEAVRVAMWGTLGKNRSNGTHKWVRLMDCSTEHLCNILTYSGSNQLTHDTREVILEILALRGVPPRDINSYSTVRLEDRRNPIGG